MDFGAVFELESPLNGWWRTTKNLTTSNYNPHNNTTKYTQTKCENNQRTNIWDGGCVYA